MRMLITLDGRAAALLQDLARAERRPAAQQVQILVERSLLVAARRLVRRRKRESE